MNILVSNDDGIDCPGLLSLVDQLSELGNVYVVGPNVQQSAKSHSFTFKGKMQFEKRDVPNAIEAYALWGTPCDCVHIGIEFLIKAKIDLVVSGINIGKNAGSDVIYSGTCAAAREGMLMGIPSIAMSLDDYSAKTYDDFRFAAYVAKCVAKKYMKSDISDDYFINVNVPALNQNDVKGVKICDKYGFVYYKENYSLIEEGEKTFVNISNGIQQYCFDETDNNIEASACRNGYITITPYKADQISHDKINETNKLFDDFQI